MKQLGRDLAELRRAVDESDVVTPDQRMRAVALQSVVGCAAIPIASVGAFVAGMFGGALGAALGTMFAPAFALVGALAGAAGWVVACHFGHAWLESAILRRALARSQRPAQLSSSSSADLPIAVSSSLERR